MSVVPSGEQFEIVGGSIRSYTCGDRWRRPVLRIARRTATGTAGFP